jgi:hypothetical protein
MISHRLPDDYVMADLFSFDYDLLKNFCFLCKSCLLASFMNENEVFHFQKKKKKKITKVFGKTCYFFLSNICYAKS